MFFKSKQQKLAEKLFSDASNMIIAIKHDNDIQMRDPNATTVLLAAYIFLVAGFLGQTDVVLDMVPVYHRFMIKQGATKEQYDFQTQKLQDVHTEIRNTMIEAQDEIGNDPNAADILLFALADTTCKLANIQDPLYATRAMQDYFILHLRNAAKLIRAG